MSDIKMSDVFCCEVDASAFAVISGVVKEYADDSVMPHEYTAHAINSHDRMVEEIAELKGALMEIKNTPDVRCDECPSIASAALAKLSQEGEE